MYSDFTQELKDDTNFNSNSRQRRSLEDSVWSTIDDLSKGNLCPVSTVTNFVAVLNANAVVLPPGNDPQIVATPQVELYAQPLVGSCVAEEIDGSTDPDDEISFLPVLIQDGEIWSGELQYVLVVDSFVIQHLDFRSFNLIAKSPRKLPTMKMHCVLSSGISGRPPIVTTETPLVRKSIGWHPQLTTPH